MRRDAAQVEAAGDCWIKAMIGVDMAQPERTLGVRSFQFAGDLGNFYSARQAGGAKQGWAFNRNALAGVRAEAEKFRDDQAVRARAADRRAAAGAEHPSGFDSMWTRDARRFRRAACWADRAAQAVGYLLRGGSRAPTCSCKGTAP